MPLDYSIPTPLQYFAALVSSQDGQPLALLEAAACLAQDEYPQLDVQQVLADVDALQARLARRLAPDAGELQRLRLLNHFFYGELGFAGNSNDYYAPDNSYLHAVLRTRRGIPISLAVLWLELAQGLGLKAVGVSFPGHFLVKVRVPGGQVVLDPLTGESLSQEALVERLLPLREQQGLEGEEPPLALYLQPASARDILVRMLRNLAEIYRTGRAGERLLAVQERLVLLLPEAWSERRDRGLAHAELGHSEQAVQDLQAYLDNARGAADTGAVAELVRALRGR
ncbi:MAG TPA: transglutaminase [Comamonadaceae bacterium]|uniref:SirB1 family protein n=1 Tax=Pulveribacter sp. TaxID=2678893 RepID=UPI000ECFC23C|nr:transglutaminase-like domain-containing protein [Pulveribacter sp.]HCL87655.1 transglutaminase [Comamonadaceae bacterium]